ncbi:MAG: fibronectin type III domain-containing protein [Actinobacteria bacterium]|nr:fibronectin type III domain-containing protein [Actinomycetota bacterium]MCA1720882.1 fibronectin type III domain-containing protein [Actinomycetota bacterium]
MRSPSRARRALAVASLTALAAAGAVALPSSAATAAASYEIVHAPTGLAGSNDAGEPSVGSNWSTGNLLYQSGLRTYKISPTNAWSDVSSTLTSTTSLDPILFTDRRTNRTFVSQLSADCSLLAFTDNDGASWTQNPVGCGLAAGADHQTVGGGPFAAGATGSGVTYPDATYYCAQAVATAQCSLSNNGGLSFNPAVPIYNATQCGGLHGHVMVGPNGYAYVPNADCGGKQGFSYSKDNGTTWTVATVPGSATQDESDSAVGIDNAGTAYLGFQQASTVKGVNETYPYVSSFAGGAFSAPKNVDSTGTIKNIQFPRMLAGDAGRVAFAYLGTTTAGDDQASSFAGIWHLYVATSLDGGQTWDNVKVTPDTDPVQKGCIWLGGGSNTCRNLLDFMGSTLQKDGSVVIGYADGCNDACGAGGKSNYGADATIARQVGGPLLFGTSTSTSPAPATSPSPAASPSPTGSPAAATAPSAPQGLTAKSAGKGGISLAWSAPASDGGSAVTSYTVYRRTSSTTAQAVAQVPASTLSYKDSNVTSGTAYTYYVTAANSVGVSPPSNEATATAR